MAVTFCFQIVISIWDGFLSRPSLSVKRTRHIPEKHKAGSRWWLCPASREVKLPTIASFFEIPIALLLSFLTYHPTD